MNPSYDSGGANNASGIPGVRPGVISSGPGPNAGAGSSMGPSMSSGPSMTPMPSLKVSKNDGAKPKKGLVIAGLIAIVFLIVAGVVAVVMMNNGGKKTQTNDSVKMSSFNRLINYITSGNDSEAAVTAKYKASADYYLKEIGAAEDDAKKIEVYNKASDLMAKFASDYRTKYNGASGEKNERLLTLVNSTDEMAGFMAIMTPMAKLTGYEIKTMAATYGTESARRSAIAYYDFSGLSNNSYATQFMEAYEEWVTALLSNSDATSGLYKNAESYYDMTDNFIISVYNINSLMENGYVTGVENNGEANE